VPANVTVDASVYAKFWCDAITAAENPATIANQDKPENHWNTHPAIDGCDPDDDSGGKVPK